MTCISFPWLPLEAELSIFDVSFSFKVQIFELELINRKGSSSMPKHTLSKNVCFENIREVVQQIVMS